MMKCFSSSSAAAAADAAAVVEIGVDYLDGYGIRYASNHLPKCHAIA
jgi:hypothetical protein